MSNGAGQLPNVVQGHHLLPSAEGTGEQTFSISEVAKMLDTGMGRNKFIDLLKRWGYILQNGEPSQYMISHGHMKLVRKEIALKDRPARYVTVCRITINGLSFLQRKVRQHFKNQILNQRPLP